MRLTRCFEEFQLSRGRYPYKAWAERAASGIKDDPLP